MENPPKYKNSWGFCPVTRRGKKWLFFLFTFECEIGLHSQPSVCTGVGHRICTACISTNVQYENEETSSQNPELKGAKRNSRFEPFRYSIWDGHNWIFQILSNAWTFLVIQKEDSIPWVDVSSVSGCIQLRQRGNATSHFFWEFHG